MSNYTQSTNFATKDALTSGDPLKIVKGTEINTEFVNIAVAIATKLDSASGTITGATTLSGVTTISDAQRPVIDNIKLGYATTATAAGTTTLTVSSPNQQLFTGTTTQTIVLPVTSTLVLGLGYTITNNSTGVLTIQSSGLNDIVSVPAKATVKVVCILITGTTAASWSYLFEGSSNIPFNDLKNISASVSGNALTVTLNPCTLNFRSSTLTSGAFLTRSVPTAITLTVSSGSTLGTTSAVESKLAIVAIDNAGTVELAIINSTVYGAFDEAELISTTAEGGVGGADSGSVFYSTTARTSVAFRVIGYVISTQATAGTWASAPSNLSGNSVIEPAVPSQLSTASGSAPSYSARAWVIFDGTGTPAILASGNVSSITDNGTGNYTVNFTTALPDANYAVSGDGAWSQSGIYAGVLTTTIDSTRTASALQVSMQNISGNGLNPTDSPFMSVAVFR